jgi:hypothetical protein
VLFQQCLVHVFGFLKKLLFFQTTVGPPLAASVLHISHSSSLPRLPSPLGPSHFPLRFFNPSSPPPNPSDPSHFPLWSFTPSTPRPFLRMSLFFFYTCLAWSRSSCNPVYRHSGRVTLPQVGSKWVHWLPTLHITNGESTRSTLRYCL